MGLPLSAFLSHILTCTGSSIHITVPEDDKVKKKKKEGNQFYHFNLGNRQL
jgi:hypothetical protein